MRPIYKMRKRYDARIKEWALMIERIAKKSGWDENRARRAYRMPGSRNPRKQA